MVQYMRACCLLQPFRSQLFGVQHSLSWIGRPQLGNNQLVLLLGRLLQLCTAHRPQDIGSLLSAECLLTSHEAAESLQLPPERDFLTLLLSSAEYSMFLMAISTPKPGSCSLPLLAPSSAQGCAVSMHAGSRTGRRA